ncbi:MAG TPA: PEP-CTERM sorting domain-containing protein [Lacipirellula sp.]
MKRWFGLFLVGLMAAPASAQIVVDGTRDAAYGGPLAVQTVQTQFGDANPNGGSELDAGYGLLSPGLLNLMLTGNIEANFNKLEIFIDSKAGGQSVFDSSGNDNAQNMDGLVFDNGFTADYHIIVRRGSDGGGPKFDLDFADLGAQSASGYFDILVGGGDSGIGATGTGVNALPIAVAYDNSNTAGVTGGTAAADQTAAAAVTTGLELAIALSDLDYAGGPIRVMAGQNNGDHNYWSNQFLGGLAAPQGNLGGDGAGGFTGEGAIDFTTLAGDQFFTIIPEPSTLALAGLSALGVVASRIRRKK